MTCHCSGVGSKANWNACSVQPSGAAYLRAIVLERGHRPGRTMGGGTPAVEPGAEAGQDLGHVSGQVIVDLGRIDHHQPPSLSGECSFHVLGPEPREAVPMLDYDGGHGRVTQPSQELPTLSVQRRADLGHDATASPSWAAQVATRATCRSRSER